MRQNEKNKNDKTKLINPKKKHVGAQAHLCELTCYFVFQKIK